MTIKLYYKKNGKVLYEYLMVSNDITLIKIKELCKKEFEGDLLRIELL